jgi:S1-C subfamily serine protease
VVTNAHVVAGERSTSVRLNNGRGTTLRATVIGFDESRDLALLAVPGLAIPSLPIINRSATAEAELGLVGTKGAVFGHPGGENAIAITPAAISQFVAALGRDLYDQRDTKRDVFILASDLRPGDSGGALVNQVGQVVGVAFAIAPDRPGTSYALSYTEVDAFLAPALAKPSVGGVGTGPCLSD